jgi:ureidoglycolate hydrolase
MKQIKIERLNQAAFKPYGYAIAEGEGIPDIQNRQIDYWDNVADITGLGSMGALGFMRVKKKEIILSALQMLYDSPELYITLDGNPSVIFVALTSKESEPDLVTLKAFLMENGQSVAVNEKVWHCTPFTLSDKTDFALILKNNVIIKNPDGSFGVDLTTIAYADIAENYTISR